MIKFSKEKVKLLHQLLQKQPAEATAYGMRDCWILH